MARVPIPAISRGLDAPGEQRRRSRALPLLVSLGLLLPAACGPDENAPALSLPPRSTEAPGATDLIRDLRALDLDDREQRIYAEFAQGNIPDWFRALERVEMSGEIDGREHRVVFWVTPDYLTVGSDDDHLLVPLSPTTAQRIADLADASLPTAPMVDAVWASARVRLSPIRIPPDETMTTVPAFSRHDGLIRAQRWLRKADPGVFVAGHKLDVVLSTAVSARPGEAALYGWHRPDGVPIQPFYPLPDDSRPTFAHGVRLVHRRVLVDDASADLREVLNDPELAPILTGAGALEEF